MSVEQSIINRLDEILKEKKYRIIPLGDLAKYAIFSDLHLGDGKESDNFTRNEETMEKALEYYAKKGYSVMLLGDVEEFWQFSPLQVRNRYDDTIYKLFKDFRDNRNSRVFRIFGNHDHEWSGLVDPTASNGYEITGSPEAILLGEKIFMVHGHQGDVNSDENAWRSRLWVRLFKVIEPICRIFGYEECEATKSQVPKNREKVLYKWAKENKLVLICGHTHRAMFASRIYFNWLKNQLVEKIHQLKSENVAKEEKDQIKNEIKNLKKDLKREKKRGRNIDSLESNGDTLPCYFNTGSGLYRGGITCIEIEKDKIRLLKWHNDRSLSDTERREPLWKEENLKDIFLKVQA